MPWYICIKTIRGNAYYYQQRTWREGGAVKCHSIYMGPVGSFIAPPTINAGGGLGLRGPSERTLAKIRGQVAYVGWDEVKRLYTYGRYGQLLAEASNEEKQAFIQRLVGEKLAYRGDQGVDEVSADVFGDGMFGRGLYLTPAFVEAQLDAGMQRVFENRQFSHMAPAEGGSLVTAFDTSNLNLFDICGEASRVDGRDAYEALIKAKMVFQSEPSWGVASAEVAADLRAQGYDGITVRDRKELIVFPECVAAVTKVDHEKLQRELGELWESVNKPPDLSGLEHIVGNDVFGGLSNDAHGVSRDRFVINSLASLVAYRGDPADRAVTSLDVSDGLMGEGFYLRPSIEGAKLFANRKEVLDANGKFSHIESTGEEGQVNAFSVAGLRLFDVYDPNTRSSGKSEYEALVEKVQKEHGIADWREAQKRLAADLQAQGYDGISLHSRGELVVFERSTNRVSNVSAERIKSYLEVLWDQVNAAPSDTEVPVAKPRYKSLDEAVRSVEPLKLPFLNRNGSRPVSEKRFLEALEGEEQSLAKAVYYAEHGRTADGKEVLTWGGKTHDGRRFIDFIVSQQAAKVRERQEQLAKFRDRRRKAEQEFLGSRAEAARPEPHLMAKLSETLGSDKIAQIKIEARKYASADEFIRSQGESLYHTTGSEFEKFDRKYLGSQTGEVASNTGQGFFFSDRLDVLDTFKTRLSEGVENWRGEKLEPRDVSNFRTIEKIIPKAKFIHMDKPEALGVRECEVLAKYFGSESGEAMKGEAAVELVREVLDDDFGMMDAMADDTWVEGLRKHLTRHGYAGLVTNMGEGIDQYVVFNPNKFVSRDELEMIWQDAQGVSDKETTDA